MSKAGLYFHIPFCLRKCAYCDFCSFTNIAEEEMRAYTRAMLTEMEGTATRAENTVFDTVFFGGGTPSLLPIDCIALLLERAKDLFRIETSAEITLEANPATAAKAKLSALKTLGINRLSVGVQSLVAAELSVLGRLHDAKTALTFLHDAREVGFENINVDLMYGIPYQTVESAEQTLLDVLAFSPEHISAYSLMLEEGTPLYQKKDVLPFPGEEEEDAIDAHIKTRLKEYGYLHYEVSNYAKAGRESRHNLHYWHSDPYLGFGVAAYSFFGGVRYGNHGDLGAYLSRPLGAIAEKEVLNEDALAYEWIMLRLRLREGISLPEYRLRFGVDFLSRYHEKVSHFVTAGLMKIEGERVFLTERGLRVSNSILLEFMPD